MSVFFIKSDYRNVCWSKSENKWLVQLQINGKGVCLGKFPYEELDQAGNFAEKMRQKILLRIRWKKIKV